MNHARADLGGEFPGESWDEAHARWTEQDATSAALAMARADRGQWLTPDERAMLNRLTMWGSDAYPIQNLGGSRWSYDWPGAPMYPTRRAAHCAFQILSGTWSHLASLESVTVTGEDRG